MAIEASVVIPTYNREQILEKTLQAILNQSLPLSDYEVVVVDDGSTDGTDEMIKNQEYDKLITYVRQKNQGRAIARNHGISIAKGELIIFIDSDIIVNHKFVEAHLREHRANPKSIVNGIVINTSKFDHPTNESQKLTDYSRASFATGNSSVAKEFLLEAGLFDEDFNQYGWEDLELGHRLLRLGLKRVKATDAIGYHYNPPVSLDYLPELLRKERERGKMALLFFEKSPTVRTKLTTMYASPFFLLERIINFGGWPDWQITDKFLDKLKKNGQKNAFRFLAQFKLIHAYFQGMREGRRRSKK